MRLGTAYYGAFLEEHVRLDMEEIKNAGCGDVCITLSENDMKYFPGKARLAPEIGKRYGLRLFAVPWGFGNLFGGGRMSTFILDNPEAMQIDAEGGLVGAGCYNNEIFRDHYRAFIEKIDVLGYDGILVDEPTPIDCYCDACKRKYKGIYGETLPSAAINNIDPSPQRVTPLREFRKECVIDFTRGMCDYVKASTRGLLTQVAMMPVDFQMWERIAAIESLDIFGVDPYWLLKDRKKPFEWFVRMSQRALDLCRRMEKVSLIWINCWNIAAGDEEEIGCGVREAASLEPDMIYAWSFKGAAGTNEACENPRKAWEALVKEYRELKYE